MEEPTPHISIVLKGDEPIDTLVYSVQEAEFLAGDKFGEVTIVDELTGKLFYHGPTPLSKMSFGLSACFKLAKHIEIKHHKQYAKIVECFQLNSWIEHVDLFYNNNNLTQFLYQDKRIIYPHMLYIESNFYSKDSHLYWCPSPTLSKSIIELYHVKERLILSCTISKDKLNKYSINIDLLPGKSINIKDIRDITRCIKIIVDDHNFVDREIKNKFTHILRKLNSDEDAFFEIPDEEKRLFDKLNIKRKRKF